MSRTPCAFEFHLTYPEKSTLMEEILGVKIMAIDQRNGPRAGDGT